MRNRLGKARPIRPGIKEIFLAVVCLLMQVPPCTAFLTTGPSRIAKPTNHNNVRTPVHRMSKDDSTTADNSSSSKKSEETLLSKGLTLAVWTIPLDALLVHFQGWSHFLSSLSEMKAHSSAEEFSSALTFWLFGAVSHPLVHGAFGISEIMHSSLGPSIAGLVPLSFACACGLFGYVFLTWEKVRLTTASLLLASFLAYVGSGLDGTTESLLADYNIQLDDDYQGRVVKGCPSPESVQSTSVRNFDYSKYQGRWYWHKVHDWTQFDEMYDTSLDIRLTDNGYINTLFLKGPSPVTIPLSWDKSPLLNGVRYSWEGRIDKEGGGPPGVSQESGFGVSFPNYIIDAQTKSEASRAGSGSDNRYQELIKFQCIEVGGVRLYEGVDFMSRSPTMTDQQLEAMHQRAKALNRYGAAPEQMHRIDHQADISSLVGGEALNKNEWQTMWKRLGIANYLDQSLN